jgi:thiamine-phosphate pyrophosphorylase
MCEEVVALARSAGAIVVVNDRVDIARLSRADGVHVGQDDLAPEDARRVLGAFAVVGLSTHTREQASAAIRAPIDYVAVGPIFGTSTKDTGYGAVGTVLVKDVRSMLDAQGTGKPLVAIGGITLTHAPDVIRAGAHSVAVISDLLSTGDPAGRVREYVQALQSIEVSE